MDEIELRRDTTFKIVRNDITKMHVDAIVNTANREPVYSAGTDAAVYKAAGEECLLRERKKIGVLKEGEVAITPGFALPAKYIIHAVSPLYVDGESGEEQLLRSCYRKSLALAYEKKCNSIAFPLIATGNFGYPKEEGMRIALDEIQAFLLQHEMLIYLVVYDTEATRLGRSLYPALEEYIDRHYVELNLGFGLRETKRFYSRSVQREDRMEPPCERSCAPNLMSAQVVQPQKSAYGASVDFLAESEAALNERMQHMSDTFQQYLLYLIESKGLKNSDVYKRAIITKQLFSKIKVNPEYHPDKTTAMRLCIGAGLNLDETKDLLARAGYALSPCDKRDIIFSFFIEHEVYDMIEIDIALEEHGLPCFIE